MLVLTDGIQYISTTEDSSSRITNNIELAEKYDTITNAVKIFRMLKTNNREIKRFYVFDTQTNKICWRYKNRYIPHKTRLDVYYNAGGRCEMCGKPLSIYEFTIDHIMPISHGGTNDINNLACTCKACNTLKGHTAPDEFNQRITSILLYQVEKKRNNSLKNRLMYLALKNLMV